MTSIRRSGIQIRSCVVERGRATSAGGAYGMGTVFSISPSGVAAECWTETAPEIAVWMLRWNWTLGAERLQPIHLSVEEQSI
ncbi:MAG: hypothetical protein WB810_16770 [Candidatus Cybelea sp.]